MSTPKFDTLKISVQLVIDLMANKEFSKANFKLTEASDLLDEILDFSDDDEDLIEISRYQVLLNQLQMKINAAGSNN